MDMNRAFFQKTGATDRKWLLMDAEGEVLGRLATKVADTLRGKLKPEFTSHVDCGDYVVIINAEKIVLTGNKLKDKEYRRYTGWMGGLKIRSAEQVMEKDPAIVIETAVKRMLPKNTLSRQIIKKLKVYGGAEHPHKAQLEEASK